MRARRRPCPGVVAAAVLALLCVTSAKVAARSFADNFGVLLRPLGDALALPIASSFPVIAASPGLTFAFDFATGTFVRSSELLGQLFLERAETVGRGKWNLSLDYQRVNIDTINGKEIEHLHDTTPILVRPGLFTFTIPELAIDLDAHEFTLSTTYGVTENLDVNVVVPVVYSEPAISARFSVVGASAILRVRDSALGVGDLFLRGKYRALQLDWVNLAGAFILRLPTGNEDNFQGTASVELEPLLIASTPPFAPIRWLRLRGYANGGVNLDAEDVGGSEGRWGIGLDWLASDRFTAAVALLARHAVRGTDLASVFLRRDPQTGRTFFAPLFGIRDRRPDFYDLSLGGRVNLWRDTVIGFLNVVVPLNRDGFRADVIPLAGIEATF